MLLCRPFINGSVKILHYSILNIHSAVPAAAKNSRTYTGVIGTQTVFYRFTYAHTYQRTSLGARMLY